MMYSDQYSASHNNALLNTKRPTAVTKCDLIPPVSALTETSILFTDGHTDEWTGLFHYTPKNIHFAGV